MHDSLDKIDIRILKRLQYDAHISNNDLAEHVGLSPSPCWRRVKRLRELGYITRDVAILNGEKLGVGLVVIADISLTSQQESVLKTFEATLLAHPEVTECYTIGGNVDYILRIVAKDMKEYEHFLRRELLSMDIVKEVHSHFVVTQVKYTTEIPIDL